MLRKLAVWLLLIPLPFNGLWMVCQDAPAANSKSVNLFAQQEVEINESLNDSGANSQEQTPECVKECSMKSAAKSGTICLISPGGKSSITLSLFGVALLPPQIVLQHLASSVETVSEPANQYFNPAMAVLSPPPKA